MFKKLNTQTNWILGSLTNEIGSEYTFGYDVASDNLLWLEHYGKKLSKEDKLWDEAKAYIAAKLSPSVAVEAPKRPAQLGTPAPESERPSTVQRSVVSRSYPTIDNENGMGTTVMTEAGGIDVEDDDIASRAAEFLSGQLDAEELEYVNE